MHNYIFEMEMGNIKAIPIINPPYSLLKPAITKKQNKKKAVFQWDIL